jgi:hypothetical protein
MKYIGRLALGLAMVVSGTAAQAEDIDSCLKGTWWMFEMEPSVADLFASTGGGRVRIIDDDNTTISLVISSNGEGNARTTWHQDTTFEIGEGPALARSRYQFHHEVVSTIRRTRHGAYQIATLSEPHGPGQGTMTTEIGGQTLTAPVRPAPALRGWQLIEVECRRDTLKLKNASAASGQPITIWYHRAD